MRGWLLRHTPWWVAAILWWVPMLLFGALAVTWLTGSIRLAIRAALDTDLANALAAILFGYISVLVAAWWVKEARHWREITPRALRPGSNPS